MHTRYDFSLAKLVIGGKELLAKVCPGFAAFMNASITMSLVNWRKSLGGERLWSSSKTLWRRTKNPYAIILYRYSYINTNKTTENVRITYKLYE